MPLPIERCCLCDEPTGRAGRGEDSIYINLPYAEVGPLCETCQSGIEEWCAENTGMEAKNSTLQEKLTKVEQALDRLAGLNTVCPPTKPLCAEGGCTPCRLAWAKKEDTDDASQG